MAEDIGRLTNKEIKSLGIRILGEKRVEQRLMKISFYYNTQLPYIVGINEVVKQRHPEMKDYHVHNITERFIGIYHDNKHRR